MSSCAKQTICFKRGGYFGVAGVFRVNGVANLTGWTNIQSQIRDDADTFLRQLTVEILDIANGIAYIFWPGATYDWIPNRTSNAQPDRLLWDVIFVNDQGQPAPTQTIILTMDDRVTQLL